MECITQRKGNEFNLKIRKFEKRNILKDLPTPFIKEYIQKTATSTLEKANTSIINIQLRVRGG